MGFIWNASQKSTEILRDAAALPMKWQHAKNVVQVFFSLYAIFFVLIFLYNVINGNGAQASAMYGLLIGYFLAFIIGAPIMAYRRGKMLKGHKGGGFRNEESW